MPTELDEVIENLYRGPPVHPSAWSMWELGEGQSPQTRLRRLGTVIELDEESTGDFRYCSNDFDKPSLVTRYGARRNVQSFGSPELLHGLRERSVLGRRLSQKVEEFGSWTAEVMSASIAITNPFAVCHMQQLVQFSSTGPSDAVSVNMTPIAFKVSNGISDAVDLSWEAACKFVKLADYEGIFDLSVEERNSNKGRTQAELEHLLVTKRPTPDILGELRRTMATSTKFKKQENASAEEFLRLPVLTRIATVNAVEMDNLANIRAQGLISLTEFLSRSDAIAKPSSFPQQCLRAKNALDKSMYLDADTREHLPQSLFAEWAELTWTERLRAAKATERRALNPAEGLGSVGGPSGYRSSGPARAMKNAPAQDPELPPDKSRSELYQAMLRGEDSGGVRKHNLVHRQLDRAERRQARLGKEITQVYEECDKCGRPCLIAGSGLCPRCMEFERERALLGVEDDWRKPDTYLGDPRALLGHPGFDHYIPVPPPEEQPWRAKIDAELASTPATGRRSMLGGLDPQLVEPPLDMSWMLQPSRRRQNAGAGALSAGSGGEEPADREEVERLHALIKGNKVDEVKALLLRDIAARNVGLAGPAAGSAQPGAAASRVVDARDVHGNTPLIAAAQQGHRRMCKLLLAAEAGIDAQNKEGNTALHYAAMYGYRSLFDYLTAKGADRSVTNTDGLLCDQMAARPVAAVLDKGAVESGGDGGRGEDGVGGVRPGKERRHRSRREQRGGE